MASLQKGTDRRIGRYTMVVDQGRPAQGDQPEVGPTYRHASAVMGFPTIPDVTTLYESFRTAVEKYGDRQCLGWRTPQGPYEFLTYQEVLDKAKALSSALWSIGARQGAHVGICGANTPEWMITAQALSRISAVTVPLYDTLGANAVEYILRHAEIKVVFVASEKLKDLVHVVPALKSQLRAIVYWGAGDEEALAELQASGLAVHQFDKLLEGGAAAPADAAPPKSEDPACIMYTSGTTGDPKGVVLTHANLVAGVAGVHVFLRTIGEAVDENDSYFSFLPLAHCFGRIIEEAVLSVGAAIGYWQGSPKLLMGDVRALRPTLFAAVPTVLVRVQNETMATLAKSPSLIRRIFMWCVQQKVGKMYKTGSVKKPASFIEGTFFKSVRGAFGGRVRFIVSGGAPLAVSVQEFLQATMSTPIIQGYGMTETCAASFLATGHPDFMATVGPPLAPTEFRLEAVPELGYSPSSNPPRGEICIRGPMVFAGYHKAVELTQECFDSDGFLHSGDVGEITAQGGLKIIDRKKNIFKLSQGEYVASEYLENVYQKADVVEQVWVYGNSFESTLVAVVVPSQAYLAKWAKVNLTNAAKTSYDELLATDQARAYVLSELTAVGKSSKVKGFEMIKAVHLERDEWEMGGAFLTPSFKLKRAPLQQHYQKEIDEMYSGLRVADAQKRAQADAKRKAQGG